MTDKTSVVTFTAEEKAMLDGTAELKLEESNAVQEGAPEPAESKLEAEPAAPDAEKPEAEEGDEEVIEVADGTNPDGKPRRTVISFKAYDKERRAKQTLAEEAAKLREQVAYLSGLSQNAPKAPQALAAEQELSLTPPDKAKEPEKYLEWVERGLSTALTKLRQQETHTQQNSQFQQINDTVLAHEQAFINGDPTNEIEPHPDFHEAVKFLQDKHRAELKEAGYEPHEIQQIMSARAQSVAVKALQAGKSPAERVYSLAKLNGYKKAAPKETEAEKIARQAKNQAKEGKTISSLPGGESSGGLTAESLANMDPLEFKKKWDNGEAKKILGWKD
jgi:hypothetical protein